MAQPSATDWATGWDAKDAPQIGFAFLRADADQWQDGPWPGLQSMELGLTEASKGMFSARRVRVAPGKSVPRTVGADTGWYRHDGDFDFVYVLHGAVMVETEDGAHHTLGPGASATYPRLTARREYAATPDLEYLWVTVPGELPVVGGGEAPVGAAGRPAVITYDRPDSYVVANGPRTFFEYRDLGTADATDRRIHIHAVHAVRNGEPTGWHYHSMAQWFLIIEGSADLEVEERPTYTMGPLDSMCLGRGMRHNVAQFSSDYKLIEMCVPADYTTVGAEPPQRP